MLLISASAPICQHFRGRDLARIAQWLSDQWQGANALLLEG